MCEKKKAFGVRRIEFLMGRSYSFWPEGADRPVQIDALVSTRWLQEFVESDLLRIRRELAGFPVATFLKRSKPVARWRLHLSALRLRLWLVWLKARRARLERGVFHGR